MKISRPHFVFKVILGGLISASIALTACSQSSPELSAAPQQNVKAEMRVKHVDAKGAQSLLAANENIVVLDIRTSGEIKKGHIRGAEFVNFYDDDFPQQLSKLDRQAPYIVHCKSGGRSTKALQTLQTLGFTDITHMDGGLDGWKRDELPLVTPN